MNQNYEAIVTMIKELGKAVSEKISHAPYDRTTPAVVVGIEGLRYKILMQGMNYIVPCSTDITLSVTDKVWVTIPCNKYNKMYISGRRFD